MLTRRTFVKNSSLLSAGGVALSCNAAVLANMVKQPSIHLRKLKASSELLPILGIGTSSVFDVNMAEENRAPLRTVLSSLFKAGGSVIDTAHNYGRAENVLGDLITDLKAHSHAFFCSKVHAQDTDLGKLQIDQSFKRLKTGTIDLYYVHNLVGLKEQYKLLQEFKSQGKIRHIGLSHFSEKGIDEIVSLIKAGMKPDFIQVPYSLSLTHAEHTLLPLAADTGISVVANQPFGKGALFRSVKGKRLPTWAADLGINSWAQFFLKYITSNTAINCVIPGTSKPLHAIDNIQAATGYLLTNAERRALLSHWQAL